MSPSLKALARRLVGSSQVAAGTGLGAAVLEFALSRRSLGTRRAAARSAALGAAVAWLGLIAIARDRVARADHTRQSREVYRQAESAIRLSQRLNLETPLPHLRGWAISPDAALILLDALLEVRPSIIVDLGSGSSTHLLATAAKRFGLATTIISVDHLDDYVAMTEHALEQAGVADAVTLAHAPLVEHVLHGKSYRWYSLEPFRDTESIDLLFIDGPPKSAGELARYPALPLLHEKLSEKAIVVVDDAGRPEEQEAIAAWRAEFPLLTFEYLDAEKGCCVGYPSGSRPAFIR